MPDVKIVTSSAFMLSLPNGGSVFVPQGESTVAQEVADHWFTKAHLVGTPKGTMPIVQGEGGAIEADEAGQRVSRGDLISRFVYGGEPPRQEGPVSWSKDNDRAQEVAQAAAQEAGTEASDPVDGKAAAAKKPDPDKAAQEALMAAGRAAAQAAAATAAPSEPATLALLMSPADAAPAPVVADPAMEAAPARQSRAPRSV